jgi:hypothetical protein
MNSQSREGVAAQLRAWAASRSLPSDQIEQMVSAVRSGLYDDQILRARTTVTRHDQQQQQQPFAYRTQPLSSNSHPPFNGFFPMPAMPAMPTITPLIPNPAYPIPPTSVPFMFPTTALQNAATPINQSSTTTNFPGGQSTQQTSSYSGQQGNTTFQYSSSSTSTSFNPSVHFPPTTQHGFPAAAHLTRFMTPAPLLQQQQQQQTLLQPQHHHHHYQQQQQPPPPPPPIPLPMRPRDHNPTQHSATLAAVQPESPSNPVTDQVMDQEPQNPRLADTFRRQLEADEATYFSPVPGRADRSVER